MGLGGGCLILVYNSTTKQTVAIDAREEAPKESHRDLFANISGDRRLPLSIGVPGELAGYWELHQRFGRLEWSQLFNGAIELSRNGFYVCNHLDNALKYMSRHINNKFSTLRKLFIDPDTNECYKRGHKMSNEKLAQTLERLANSSDPIELFYRVIAKDIIKDIQEFTDKSNFTYLNKTIITLEDFHEYKSKTNLIPVKTHLKRGNYTLHSFPLPGSGDLLAFMLKVMEQYEDDMNHKTGKSLNKTTLFYHRLIETFKFAFSRRTLLEEDTDYNNHFVKQLTSDEFAKEIKELIDDSKTFPIKSGKYGNNIHITEDKGTAHVSVIDGKGNAVSISTTINSYFGSKIYSKRTGIILNDELFDFKKYKYPANETNLINPGKRPLSSMCPTIVTDSKGRVRLVIGGAGGTKITTGVAFVMLRHLWFEEDIKKAIDAHRLHHQFSPDHIVYEKEFSEQILNGLSKLGHKLSELKGRGSVIMAISADHKLSANSDYRKGGDVDGL
ncbi:unnamed protein product [Oppiella nova]|uniref:Gamma-glutamyltransferase n=1 Tax=Oppiella nova TaxID=334625 RepID=A0A7R9LWX0_9ACAR|nr:unnamed protein product [Oppiella nova]CAG2167074.1 unnamed protein product [Oppiella nova]